MSHRIIFYPVGNGDTSQIILSNGRRILFDFRHIKKTGSENRPEINLKERLNKELKDAKRDYFDIVAFTHSDSDHIDNSTEFFELRHAKKYQGEGRIKVKTLWVPAAMILETATNDDQSSEYVIWRQEARYRLKAGEGIRVFSKPDMLKEWLKENNISIESVKHLFTDAGQIVPEFSLDSDGVEFFCHSPFVHHVEDNEEFRNEAALIFNVRLKAGVRIYNYLAVGDSKWEILEDIVNITLSKKRADRLMWDLYNIPHHCSYMALSDEKGESETVPKEAIKKLLKHGQEGAFLISSSDPIEDSKQGREQIQPPHIQAKKCYEHYLSENEGCKLLVTMEEPNKSKPEPIEFVIDENGIRKKSSNVLSATRQIISTPAPRAGN